MSSAKVTVSIDRRILDRIDRLVKSQAFASRSQAVQTAVEEKLLRWDRTRLARECGKLDPSSEQALADIGLASEAEDWPPY
jgi:Arc/MetJ-type ribon-helix-helix transcriptional regulator